MESGQLSAAVTAIKEKGVLSGMRIERAEIGGPGEFDQFDDDELHRLVVERFARPGLAATWPPKQTGTSAKCHYRKSEPIRSLDRRGGVVATMVEIGVLQEQGRQFLVLAKKLSDVVLDFKTGMHRRPIMRSSNEGE
jgi:hypothetical protein